MRVVHKNCITVDNRYNMVLILDGNSYRERNKNRVPILIALIDKMYPDNSIWNSLQNATEYYLNFGRRGQSIISFNKFQAQYKFKIIVINIDNNSFGKNLQKDFDCITPPKSKQNIYRHYRVFPLELYNCADQKFKF